MGDAGERLLSPSFLRQSRQSPKGVKARREGGDGGRRRALAFRFASVQSVLSRPLRRAKWRWLRCDVATPHVCVCVCLCWILHLLGHLGGPKPSYRAYQTSRSTKASEPKHMMYDA